MFLLEGVYLSLDQNSIYRVLDVNSNRLREALRVIEEYFRFVENSEDVCIELKEIRHSLIGLEEALGRTSLLKSRDTSSDCFADSNRPEEMIRDTNESIVIAGFRRAQEASRVIEEFIKLTSCASWAQHAKKMRFTLYRLEKHLLTV